MRAALVLLLLSVIPASARAAAAPQAIPAPAAIDHAARSLMAREHVQGLALAVIDSGRVRYVQAYGFRNAARHLPLTTRTVMYGASLTKTAFTDLVLQLVDEGLLSLDTPIAELLPKPLPEYDDYRDLAGDGRWRALTPRILLTHSSGLANFRWLEPDRKHHFHFTPGTRYAYSGDGFYLLQFVLEQGLGIDVGRAMQTRVFDRFGLERTSMTWRDDFASDLADGYRIDGREEPHDRRDNVSAAGSMDTDIEDQAKLWAAIMRGDGLSDSLRAEMVRPQLAITSAHQFPTFGAGTGGYDRSIGLAAGLGLVTFRGTGGPAWFKGGHNEWTGNMAIGLENGRRCLVMLSNDVRAERLYPDLARAILGPIRLPWNWEYDWYRPPAGQGR